MFKYKVSVLMILFLCFFAGQAGAYSIPEIVEKDGVLWVGEAWVLNQEGIKVAYFTGSPLEIGIQSGLLGVDDPEEMLEVWRSLDPAYHAQGLEKVTWFFMNLYARFQFYPAFKRYTPLEYLQEMQGFILGASRGEESDIYDIMMSNASQDLALAGQSCSAFAAWGEATIDGGVYVGRNLDHIGMVPMARYQYLAFYNPEQGYPFVVHNYPSFVGTMSGMNARGIVISSNYSLAVPAETTIYGLPYMLVLRWALQYGGSIDEVIEIIMHSPRTVGLNILVADTERAVVIELTANRMHVREGEDFIFTTNQFRHPLMQPYQAPGWLASAARDDRFYELIQANWGEIDYSIARDFMRDRFEPASSAHRGFVSGINSESNLASMVFVPGQGEVWLGRVGDIEGYAPYAADGAFIGFNAHQIWATGEPQAILGMMEPTPQSGYYRDWFLAGDAAYLRAWGEYEEALALTEEVLSRHPLAEMPLYLAGRLHIHLGDMENGLHYLEQFLDLETHSEPFYLFLARVWSGLIHDTKGEREKAVDLYKRALEVVIEDMPGELTGFRQVATIGLEYPLYVDNEGQIGRQ